MAVNSTTGLAINQDQLKEHESWQFFDEKLNFKGAGQVCSMVGVGIAQLTNFKGCDALKGMLKEDECSFVFFRVFAENVNNAGAGIWTEYNRSAESH